MVVGLSTGPIVFYHLNVALDTLTHCSELDYNDGLLTNLVLEPSKSVLIGAGCKGTMSVFDLKKGVITSQLLNPDKKFVSIAYDRNEHVAFVGTTEGSVVVFELSPKTGDGKIPKKICTIEMTYPANSPSAKHNSKGEVKCVVYAEELRMLYVAHMNHIHLIAMKDECKSFDRLGMLSMNEKLRISNVLVLNCGYYVIATSNIGVVAMFDISDEEKVKTRDERLDEAARDLSIGNGKASDNMANTSNKLSTTASRMKPWNEIILQSNGVMRDWLRAKGVDSSVAVNRADLIRIVIKAERTVTPTMAAKVLRPKNLTENDPTKRKRTDAMLVWSMNPDVSLDVNDTTIDDSEAYQHQDEISPPPSPVPPTSPHKQPILPFVELPPLIRASAYIEAFRCMCFGTKDGTLRFVSLADFMPAKSKMEELQATQMREEALRSDATPEGIMGSRNSTRGKRHQLEK